MIEFISFASFQFYSNNESSTKSRRKRRKITEVFPSLPCSFFSKYNTQKEKEKILFIGRRSLFFKKQLKRKIFWEENDWSQKTKKIKQNKRIIKQILLHSEEFTFLAFFFFISLCLYYYVILYFLYSILGIIFSLLWYVSKLHCLRTNCIDSKF